MTAYDPRTFDGTQRCPFCRTEYGTVEHVARCAGRANQPDRSIYVTRPMVYRRRERRVAAVIDYLIAHPVASRADDPALARLDDLVGEVEMLWQVIP
jgi:hypothetical protein